MRWSKFLFFLLLAALGYGCSTTQDVVGHGPIQKRKYRPGWHLDLAGSRHARVHTKHEEQAAQPSERVPIHRTQIATVVHPPSPSKVPVDASSEPIASVKTVPVPTSIHPPSPSSTVEIENTTIEVGSPPGTVEDTDGPRYWNRMALVSGVFLVLSLLVIALTGGGGFLGYLLFFSFITGVIGLILAIKHKEKGKGIAIAAIAFPVLLIALVIAALRTF